MANRVLEGRGVLVASFFVHLLWALYLLQAQGLREHLRLKGLYLRMATASLLLCASRLLPWLCREAPLSFLALGRAAAGACCVEALGVAAGGAAGPVAALHGMQWLQLGVAAVASEPKLHWGLFLAGALCGLLADQSLRAFQARSPHSECIQKRLALIIGFNGKMNLLASLLWFVIEMLGPPGYHMGAWNISQFQFLSLRPGLIIIIIIYFCCWKMSSGTAPWTSYGSVAPPSCC